MTSSPYLSEIDIVAFNFAPLGFALCNGQTLPINQNQALFALLGTYYGGNGSTTFMLPNLQGRAPISFGQGPGLPNYVIGQVGGEEFHTLTQSEMPAHNHSLRADAATAAASNVNAPASNLVLGQSTGATSTGGSFGVNIYSTDQSNLVAAAPAAIANGGGNQAHENRQPFLALNYCMALQGIFPSRS